MTSTIIADEAGFGDSIDMAGRRAVEAREQRVLAFWRERRHGVTQIGPDVYVVPSFTEDSAEYVVDYSEETCSCPSATYPPGRACKHLMLVGFLRAKKRRQRRENFLAALASEAQGVA